MTPSLQLLFTMGAPGTGVAVNDPMAILPVAALLLVCSAFFSGSETALFSLQQTDRTALANHRVDRLLSQPRGTLASLLIGNETVNVALSTVTAGVVIAWFPQYPWLNLLVLPPLLIVFGEILPKSLAFRFNRGVAPVVAPVISMISWVATPIRLVLMRLADSALVLTGGSTAPQIAALREAHLRSLLEHGHRQGAIRPMEKEVIDRVFEFGDLTVSRLMTPRPDMFTLKLNTPWDELIQEVRVRGISRIPVWQDSPDNVVGILLVKDLLPLLAEEHRPTRRRIQRLLRRPHFVPATKRAGDLLTEFRENKFHQSVVVDEHGIVVGLVTLDDLLAELVGDVLDETEEAATEVVTLGTGVFTIKGSMDVQTFEEKFGHALPDGDYNTLGGFVVTTLGEIPEEGTELIADGVRFTITGVDGQRVTDIRVQLRRAEGA